MRGVYTPKVVIRKVTDNCEYDTMFIPDDEVCFHIERVPSGLNLIDMVRFRNTITSSMSGVILKLFNLSDYLVYLYSKNNSINKLANPILLLKLDFLKSISKAGNSSELWIINDHGYTCIGLLRGAPIFLKSFPSIYDANEHLEIMLANIGEYAHIQGIRFFGCTSEDFTIDADCALFEYSQIFMQNAMDGCQSVDEYCKQQCVEKSSGRRCDLVVGIIAMVMTLITGSCYLVSEKLFASTSITRENVLLMGSCKSIPSPAHYNALKELEAQLSSPCNQAK